jgi:hypothetical protein
MRTGERLKELSAWVDSYPPNETRDKEAQLWGRVSKVGEEFGEVIAAMIGATNQNPRKGETYFFTDVCKEMLDVAVTALCAIEHMTGNNGKALSMMERHIQLLAIRAGLE